jgi:hypothetical protein
MRRRTFIAALGGAAAWPLLAHAEQPALPVIGFLHSEFDTLPVRQRGFRQGLKDTGFVEGENLAVDSLPENVPKPQSLQCRPMKVRALMLRRPRRMR